MEEGIHDFTAFEEKVVSKRGVYHDTIDKARNIDALIHGEYLEA